MRHDFAEKASTQQKCESVEIKVLSEFVKEQKARELFPSSRKGDKSNGKHQKSKKAHRQQAPQLLVESGGLKWDKLASKARKYCHYQSRIGRTRPRP